MLWLGVKIQVALKLRGRAGSDGKEEIEEAFLLIFSRPISPSMRAILCPIISTCPKKSEFGWLCNLHVPVPILYYQKPAQICPKKPLWRRWSLCIQYNVPMILNNNILFSCTALAPTPENEPSQKWAHKNVF